MTKMHNYFFIFLSLLTSLLILPSCSNAQRNTTFQVGVILDADSLVARIGMTSLTLCLADFYLSNSNYSTRLVLHTRDSKGRVTDAASTALSLLKDVQVDAIIGPQKSAQATFVIGLGDAANVPIISFSATSPSLHPQTPYFVQTALNDAAQVDAAAAVVKYFRWYQIVLVYEDSEFGNGITPYLANAFQQVNARVSYRSIIPVSASDDFILQELYKMKTMQTRVFVVHTSSVLASRIFLKAKEAEMTSDGYAWIVTSGIMDLFYSLNSSVVESMQGVVGVKPLIPRSSKLNSTTVRWRKKLADDNPGITPQEEINLYGLWAYDTLWALAMAAEKTGFKEPSSSPNSTDVFSTGISQTGPKLLAAILDTKFEGLAGNFQLVNGQLKQSSFEILNVNGKALRQVGIWTSFVQSSSQAYGNVTGFTGEKLENIIWPGESRNVPKGWEVPLSGKKLRVGVPSVAGFPEFVKVERDPKTNSTTITGLYIDLFDAIMAALPYAVRYEYVPFTGSYDDLPYQVSIGKYDCAVGDITITATRSEFVVFTLPIEDGGVTRTQKIQYGNDPSDKWFFFRPLKWELWLTILALFIFTGCALWILERKFNIAFRGRLEGHTGLIFYIPFMSLVFAHRENIVTNLARVVVVVWIFVILVLSSTYTASLSARLTVFKIQQGDTDINTLIGSGDYVGCRNGTFLVEFLQNLGFDQTKIRTYKLPEDFDAALSKGSEKGGITAMFSRTPYADLFLSKYCNRYMKFGSPYLTEGIAFGFPKGSPLVGDVSSAITKLTDNHRISEIKSRWIRQSGCTDNDPSQLGWTDIGLGSFKILFAITGVVTTTCVLLFLVSFLSKNSEHVRDIYNGNERAWFKVRLLCELFNERDPEYFPENNHVEMQNMRED
ncbi:hypothetical protein ABFS83_09G125400 [Erythranthe nasuta]